MILTEAEKLQIESAIKAAEKATSGEVRVHIENKCSQANVLDRATEVFATLKMHKTALRNGVLFYVAVKDKKFAILGDIGINTKVEKGFWDDISTEMKAFFKDNKLAEGLSIGVEKAGNQLKKHFPYQSNDTNELSDEISFGNN